MKTKIMAILVMTLLIATALPVAGTINGIKPRMEKENFTDSNEVLTATDGDWWPMFHYDLNNTGNSSSTAPDTNNVLWEYGTNGTVASSPAVVDGKVFFGSIDGNVYCLDESTGTWIWQYPTGDEVWSSPAVADGKVFVGSGQIASGASNVYCLDASTGLKIWDYTASGGVDSSPAVADGKVFVGSHDGNLYCLDASTGAWIWNYPTGGGVYSSPAVADGKVYFGSKDCNLYCLDESTGAWIWNYPTPTGMVTSSPAVVEGKVFFGTMQPPFGYVYCLNALTGAFIWQHATMGLMVQSSPAVADGKVFVGSFSGNLYCLDASDGHEIWSRPAGSGGVLSSPAVADGKVYFGSYDNNVYCLDESTGAIIWQHLTADDVGSSPAVADGKVYFGSKDCNLYCLGEEIPEPVPNLDCSGSLSWRDVKPGETVAGSFTVENKGEPLSMLDWEIIDWPKDWGTWTFTPSSGNDLTPEDGEVTVNVSVIAPDEKNSEFTGEVKIVNKENSSDFCTIPVSLTTPRNKAINTPFLNFLQSHPNMFPILQRLLQRLGLQ